MVEITELEYAGLIGDRVKLMMIEENYKRSHFGVSDAILVSIFGEKEVKTDAE